MGTPQLGFSLVGPRIGMPESGLRSAAMLFAEAPVSVTDDLPFRRGAPTPDEVGEHVEKHPLIDSRMPPDGRPQWPLVSRDFGAQWIVIDEQSSPVVAPQFVRLKIGTERDLVPGTEHNSDPNLVVGRVLLQNGFSFWQPLLLCKWAERSLYLPVSRRGLPL